MKNFNFEKYRNSEKETLRIESVLQMLPSNCDTVLEIGSRDGFLTRKFANIYKKIIALDLIKPDITHDRVVPVQGDITKLDFEDNSVDLIICTEVLEHIPPKLLSNAAKELARVSSKYILIGVPYKQDLRTKATYCENCKTINPTTGHQNRFDTEKLYALFKDYIPKRTEYIGYGQYATNQLSYNIFKYFNFPYGSYEQEEPCINCGQELHKPKVSIFGKVMCFFAQTLCFFHNKIWRNKNNYPIWIHVLLEKQ